MGPWPQRFRQEGSQSISCQLLHLAREQIKALQGKITPPSHMASEVQSGDQNTSLLTLIPMVLRTTCELSKPGFEKLRQDENLSLCAESHGAPAGSKFHTWTRPPKATQTQSFPCFSAVLEHRKGFINIC